MIPALLALLACGPSADAPADTGSRPNVVLITLDTTRADHLGAWGKADARTDALDALAARGRTFTRAYAPIPLTIPSHATMFTGLLPAHHGIRSNGGGVLPPDATTLAEILRGRGWRTAASVAAFVTTRRFGFDQGFDAFLDDVPTKVDDFWHGERPGDRVVDDALAWKAAQPTDRPLFLWVHLYDAHAPYRPPEGYADAASPYDGELAFVDDQVARLVAAFEGTRTLFVVAGDHGEALGDHGELTHGMYVYTATQHVPWIVAGPGIAPARIDEPVSLADLLPTVLEALHLPVPARLDGVARPAAEPRPVALESWQLAQRFGIAPHLGLIDGRWALVATPRPELYDLVADPDEALDVAADHPDEVARLKGLLDGLALSPPTSGDGAAPDMARQLAALGYTEPVAQLDLSGPLPDPKDHADLVGRLAAIEEATRTGALDRAEAVLRELVARYPTIVEHRSKLAATLARAGRFDDAREEVEAALQLDPGNPRLRGLHASQLAALGRYAEAAEGFRDAAIAMPYDPRLRAATIGALRRAGDAVQAASLGEAWREQFPDDGQLAGILGIVLVEGGDAATGIPLLEQGARAEPPELEVCFYLAAVAVAQGRLEDALALLQREVDAWPGHVRAAAAGARLALRLQRWDAQLALADAVIAKVPTAVDARHLRTLALFNLGRFDEAAEAVRAGLALDPHHPDLLLMDANLLAKAGRPDEGRRRFEEARAALEARRALTGGPASVVDELGIPDVARGGRPDAATLPPWSPLGPSQP